jgi:hypothetical protein
MNPLLLICRALKTIQDWYGNINPLSIVYATRLDLGPTNPGAITVAQETLLFRWAGFSPALWLLIPAFSLDTAPPHLTVQLQCNINAPLPLHIAAEPIASVVCLAPLHFPREIS